MKRFRITFEIESTLDKHNLLLGLKADGNVGQGIIYSPKIQRVNGKRKRKPKPNPNQLNLTGVYESAMIMNERIKHLEA